MSEGVDLKSLNDKKTHFAVEPELNFETSNKKSYTAYLEI